MTRVLAVSAALTGALLLAACSSPASDGAASSPATSPGSSPTAASQTPTEASPSPTEASPSPTPTPEPTPEDATFTILAAGDVLPHDSVLAAADTGEGWDFTQLWEPTTAWVQAADLALCHLEVPITEAREPVGYPVFASPPSLAEDLAAAGWDGCSTASNHSVDQGWTGIVDTLDALDAAGLGHVGTARSEQEAAAPQLYTLERAGRTVTVAQLSQTYSTNGIPVPAQAPWSVDMLDGPALITQARAAREAGADLVLASLHWGTEYTDDPIDSQTRLAQELAASGEIDLVIGNHPHVPQRMELLDGGPGGEGMWVAYSQGNYISNQDWRCCRPETGTGLFMWATVEVPVEGPVRISGLEWTAVPGDSAGSQRIYAMPDLLEERIETPLLTVEREELEDRQRRVEAVMGETPQRTEAPTPSGPGAEVVPRG
ncbi:CapA family protein [Serinibacter salmoneus]|uniref:Poly-gamma-glutamate synthesis protein (Capsule biosynthesis protein) n=1 Tax=Serinibacter salmoneus TaxID=556530 RepID=A0A2A9D4N3_9MICO|nr:CapA family protein [Serinibacter salmoneus]PFG20912.1 poly-gamma-glutamate synthesis protein (capsule biosynthesis protein) [Serinibacter salmoneus]